MTEYKTITSEFGSEVLVKTDKDGKVWFIPMDEANADYQAYLNKDKPKVEHLTENVPANE